jgi:hypothetical protein
MSDLFQIIEAAKKKVDSRFPDHPQDPVIKYDKSYPVESQMGMVPLTKPEPKPLGDGKHIPHEIKVPFKL